MLPVIALVGRPNVGKSTLYNRLTKTRDAIVADFAGLTRDRHYGDGKVGPRPYIVVDTGGFEPQRPEGVVSHMASQAELAIEEADAVIFIVDARTGVTPQDHRIAQTLRESGRKIYLAVNKAEGLSAIAGSEFYELGLGVEPFMVSAAPVSSDSAYIIGAPLDDVRYLYGVLPANREAYVLKGDIPDPALYLARYLTDQLQQKGIRVDGSPSCYRIEVEENRWKKGERKEIVTTYSPTLREIASVCNHVSHNLYADALVKTVGLQYKPRRNEMISSFGRGVQVVKEYWEKKGLDVFPLRMNDGSGLAPADKVSAGFMGELLVYMATESAVSDAFIASLPQAGIEGSVRNFLKGSKLQGKARLKSGGITGVRSYAGYITKDGKTYAVAVFSNNYSCPMSRMTRALEKLLLQLF